MSTLVILTTRQRLEANLEDPDVVRSDARNMFEYAIIAVGNCIDGISALKDEDDPEQDDVFDVIKQNIKLPRYSEIEETETEAYGKHLTDILRVS